MLNDTLPNATPTFVSSLASAMADLKAILDHCPDPCAAPNDAAVSNIHGVTGNGLADGAGTRGDLHGGIAALKEQLAAMQCQLQSLDGARGVRDSAGTVADDGTVEPTGSDVDIGDIIELITAIAQAIRAFFGFLDDRARQQRADDLAAAERRLAMLQAVADGFRQQVDVLEALVDALPRGVPALDRIRAGIGAQAAAARASQEAVARDVAAAMAEVQRLRPARN
ncbi:MAG: hypothetical protein AAFX81_04310 [Pseudomonadota bacterium]